MRQPVSFFDFNGRSILSPCDHVEDEATDGAGQSVLDEIDPRWLDAVDDAVEALEALI